MVRRKLYLIALTNLRFETLVMFGIRVMTKLGGVIHQVEPDRSEGKKKARPKRHNLTG